MFIMCSPKNHKFRITASLLLSNRLLNQWKCIFVNGFCNLGQYFGNRKPSHCVSNTAC